MKKLWVLTLFLAVAPVVGVRAQSTELSETTLRSPQKDGPSFINFQTGNTTSITATYGRWDLGYGMLRVNDDFDWFQVSGNQETRTAIRDLGALGWNDSFKVPVVEPFPLLKEGEQRVIVVNADGRDAKPRRAAPKPLAGPEVNSEDTLVGSSGSRGNFPPNLGDLPDSPHVVNAQRPWLAPREPTRSAPKSTPPRPPTPPTSPIFTRAFVGHIYAVHVFDGGEDFYVLLRVESLVRGENCKISWKRVPAPQAASARKQN